MKQGESGTENWEERRGNILAPLNENAKLVKKNKTNHKSPKPQRWLYQGQSTNLRTVMCRRKIF